MWIFALFLISHTVDLNYNIKYHTADLTEEDIVEMEVKRVENEVNKNLQQTRKAQIGRTTIVLKDKWIYPFGPIQLKLISYKIEGKEVEAEVEVNMLNSVKLKNGLKNNIIKMRFIK